MIPMSSSDVNQSDRQLIGAFARAGSEQAFEQLVERHAGLALSPTTQPEQSFGRRESETGVTQPV